MAGLDPVTNFATVVVDGLYDAAATLVDLQAGEGASLPATSTGTFHLVWWNATDYSNPENDPNVEIIRVTTRTGDELSAIVRAREGTAATTKNTSGKTYKMRLAPTEKFRNDIVAYTPGMDTFDNVTISSGAITISQYANLVTTEGGSGVDDDLTNINGANHQGQKVIIRVFHSGTMITVKSSGNIDIADDIKLYDQQDYLELVYYSTTWRVVSWFQYNQPWHPAIVEGTEIVTEMLVYMRPSTIATGALALPYQLEVQRNDAHCIATNIRNYTASSTRQFVAFYIDETEVGVIDTDDGSLVDYNTFRGAHRAQWKNPITRAPRGGVVISLDELVQNESVYYEENRRVFVTNEKTGRREEVDDKVKHFLSEGDQGIKPSWKKVTRDVSTIDKAKQITYISSTTIVADKRVLGVTSANPDGIDARPYMFGINDRPLIKVNALGEGEIRVTDSNGNIEAGDYLQSSSFEWEAERQPDDVLHSYTIAKAKISVDFSSVPVDPALGHKWVLIPCTLHCG
jgi:hypothetical protein